MSDYRFDRNRAISRMWHGLLQEGVTPTEGMRRLYARFGETPRTLWEMLSSQEQHRLEQEGAGEWLKSAEKP